MDLVTINRVAHLHPKLRSEVADIIKDIQSKGVDIRITQGLRTFAEQDALYAQGRTTPGKFVTNAKGGQSWHNFGLAIDFCLLHKDGTISFSITEDMNADKKTDWNNVTDSFKKFGWVYGGDWNVFKDNCHFEKTFEITLQDANSKLKYKQVDSQGYILI